MNLRHGIYGLLGVLALNSFIQAASIGVNFTGGNNAGAPTSLAATDVAGLPAIQQANFNNVDGQNGTNVALVDSTGAATGVTLTFTGGGLYGSGTGTTTANDRLLNGYVDGAANGTNTYTFNNVPAGTYELVSYALPDSLDGRTSHYSVSVNGVQTGPTYYLLSDGGANFGTNGFVRATSTTGTPPSSGSNVPTPGTGYSSGNYVEFDNITVGTGGGSITLTGVSDNFRNYSNGIQLVSVAASTPLPAAALAGVVLMGGLALSQVCRKRRLA